MSLTYLFLIEVFISVFPSLLIIVFWSKSLRQILLDLCGTQARAEFWLVYSNLMLLITPLLFVFMFGLSSNSEGVTFPFLKYAFGCAIFGDFFSVLAIGLQISKFIPRDKGVLTFPDPVSKKMDA